MKTIFSVVTLCLLVELFLGLESHSEVIVELRDQRGRPVADAIVSVAVAGTVDTAAVVAVDQVNEQFVPHVSYAYKGQHVRFPNSDNVHHHVYSFSKAKSFELKLYSGSVSEELHFDTAGVVVLGCNIHDRMVGYLYIADNELVAMTDASGRAHLQLSEAAIDEVGRKVTIWHPRLGLQPDLKADYLLTAANPAGVHVVDIELVREKKEPTKEKKNRFRSGFY